MQVDCVLKPRYKKCTEKEKIKMIVLKRMYKKNRPFSHYKFPCSLRALGMTKSIRTGASGSKCTRCIWISESVIRPNKKIGVVQVTRPTLDFYPLP